MFVKVYEYHIRSDKVNEYLNIQEKAAKIYGKYLEFKTIYLQSKEDRTKWMEITEYKDEEEYHESIKLINEEEEIQNLFKAFQSLISSEVQDVSEETFKEMKVINFR